MRESGLAREAAFFVLSHVCEAFDRLREALYRLVRVAVLYAVAHAVVYVPLEDYLPDAVERGLRRVYLRESSSTILSMALTWPMILLSLL